MDVITELFKQDFPSIILGIFIIMSAIIAVYEIICRFSSIIGKPIGALKERKADHEIIIATVKELKDLQEQHEESVKQSIRHDEMIKETVVKLSNKVDVLSSEIVNMRKIQDEDKLAEYKDRIGKSYRYYNERKYSEEQPIPYWNHMEKESLEGLIKQYEEHGGKNSFVHSIVEPEMQKWKVID